MVNLTSDGITNNGYLALPPSGKGKGILVLHAWWGLNDFFKAICDRLSAKGFVAFAPDLNHGKIATTVEEANHILETRDFPSTQATADAGHWFFEENRPDHYKIEEAKIAWERTLDFLGKTIPE